MKHFNKLLCTAVVALWALPVSALDWDHQVQAVFDYVTPELESFELKSNWIAFDRDEFDWFDAGEYALHFELFNATLDNNSGTFVIQAFDGSGSLLSTSSAIGYTVNTTNVPFILTIDPGSQTGANNFVLNAPGATRRIQIGMTLDVDVQDCDQQVRMRSWLRYNQAQVATDEPDDMVVPSLFTACP